MSLARHPRYPPPVRVLVLLLAGAALGTLFDWTHVTTSTTAYTSPTWLGLPWWIPLMYAAAGLGIGLSHPQLDRYLARPPRPLTPLALVLGIIALGAIWAGSGLLPLPHWQRGLILAPAAMLVWWTLDRTRAGLVLAGITAIAGCAAEITLSKLGHFNYMNPDIAGITSWLPWIYVAASVAVGNLGRALTPPQAPLGGGPPAMAVHASKPNSFST